MEENDKKIIFSKVEDTDDIKDSLENLCLYLNELDRMLHIEHPKVNENEYDEYKYKMQIIEQHIVEMDKVFKFMANETKNNNIIIS